MWNGALEAKFQQKFNSFHLKNIQKPYYRRMLQNAYIVINYVLVASEQDKPFKAAPKYLPTIKYCVTFFLSALKSRSLIVRARLWLHINHCFIRKYNCVTAVVRYQAYSQVSKMADNLILFLIKIFHEIEIKLLQQTYVYCFCISLKYGDKNFCCYFPSGKKDMGGGSNCISVISKIS